jgi:hypothetical protein
MQSFLKRHLLIWGKIVDTMVCLNIWNRYDVLLTMLWIWDDVNICLAKSKDV